MPLCKWLEDRNIFHKDNIKSKDIEGLTLAAPPPKKKGQPNERTSVNNFETWGIRQVRKVLIMYLVLINNRNMQQLT